LLLEKSLEDEYQDVHMMFGDYYLSELQDNLLAGGRYQLEDIDTSLEKIAFGDRVSKQFLEDVNTIMEDAIDDQIYDQAYFLKYPLPYLYRKSEFTLPWAGNCSYGELVEEKERYEVFYEGRNAVDVLEYPELFITRGTYYNELDVQTLWDTPLVARGVSNLEDIPGFDPTNISVGAGYTWHALQVQQDRAFNYDSVLPDKEVYDELKCKKKQKLEDFVYDNRGGASPLNIDFDRTSVHLKSPRTQAEFTDSSYEWHPSINRKI